MVGRDYGRSCSGTSVVSNYQSTNWQHVNWTIDVKFANISNGHVITFIEKRKRIPLIDLIAGVSLP